MGVGQCPRHASEPTQSLSDNRLGRVVDSRVRARSLRQLTGRRAMRAVGVALGWR